MPASFTTNEVAAGVWACVAPGTAGPAVSNAAIVDLGDKTIVVDTFMTVHAAQEMAAEALRLTGRQVYLAVNSHWHSDHVRGNRVFEATPIVGTRRMMELITEQLPQTPDDFASFTAGIADAADALEVKASTPEEQETAAGTRALADALAAEVDDYRLVVPDILIEDRLVIEGERSAVVSGHGKGHTESDLFLHLPGDGVVVAGDLLWTGMHPKSNDGFPAEWAEVCRKLVALSPSAVVPGHGPTGTVADLEAMASYMESLADIVAAARAGDVDPETADPPAGFEDWQGLSRFRKSLGSLTNK